VAAGKERPKLLRRPERRRALVAAAARAFARNGFGGTNLEDVATEAGVSRVLIYRHFDSKAQLYQAVLEDIRDELMDATGGPAELGPNSVDALVQVAHTNPDGFRLFFVHAAREPEFRHHADWLRTAMTETTHRYLERMVSDDAQRRWAAQLVPMVVIAAVIAWLDAGSPQPERTAATIARIVGAIIHAVDGG